ncbi:ImmA/IrrE family metallo-endopeptidase [uncultured Lactobacillus sp.]|uniref:ImmA/IrrE family metallo-endopeptidase n=1 Tax=uncultured Lactobacillus sp. TaxID=153152 RepID=UPI0025FBF205|nr:ImmA/IrrE family metallo-endopeptidase [uncultured Lactobacillus sp.]
MVTRLDINPRTLAYYIDNSGVSKDYLEMKVQNIDAFLDGSKTPTFNQLSEIAKLIDVPTGLLLLSDPVEADNNTLKFRTINSNRIEKISNELRDTIIEMQTKQDFLRNEIDYELDFIGKYSIKNDYQQVVDDMRNYLDIPINYQKNVGKNALKYFRDKMNKIGIFIFFNGSVKSNTHRSLSLDEFRGFVLSDKKAPIIFVNSKDSEAGRLFTLVHELVHLFLDQEEIFDTGSYKFDRTEAFVNKVAAEVLLPDEEIRKLNNYDIEFLAHKFPVSKFVIVRKLYDMKILTKKEYDEKVSQLEKEFAKIPLDKKTRGGNYDNNIRFRFDQTFVHYIENAIKQNKITYTDAFNIAGVSYKSFKILTGGRM